MGELAIIVALMFVAASLAIYAIYWTMVFNGRERQIIKRRLDVSRRLDNPTVDLEALRRERGFRNQTNPILRQLSDWLAQTGVRIQTTSFIMVFIARCL
ncbi:MAG: hypothetical protein WBG18_20280, partial [Xanthobacteraceae bacterium]